MNPVRNRGHDLLSGFNYYNIYYLIKIDQN